jgi:hypothetical protein
MQASRARADLHAHAHTQTRIQNTRMCVCERTSCACAKHQVNRSCVHGALLSPAVHDESTAVCDESTTALTAHHERTTAHHSAERDEREQQHATQQCITRQSDTWLIWFTRICWCMRRSPCLSYETAFDGSGFAPSYSTCHDRATVLRGRRYLMSAQSRVENKLVEGYGTTVGKRKKLVEGYGTTVGNSWWRGTGHTRCS